MRGEVTIECRTDRPDERFYDGAVLATDPHARGPLTVTSVRDHNGTILLTFKDIVDRNTAETLRNTLLLAEIDPAQSHDSADDFHLSEIVGCTILDSSGKRRGEVVDVMALPAHDTLVVEIEGVEILIPFVKRYIPDVRIDQHEIVVEDLEDFL